MTTASTTSWSAPERTTRRKSSPIRARPKTASRPLHTELARFEAFDSSARGGVSVASSQIDGSTADNIIVGSGPGIPSEVKVFSSKLPSSPGTAPELFSTFNPYLDDRNGVSVASGFVDFTTGRYSIVTAPGPGSIAQIKVFNFSLMPLLDKSKKPAGGEICEPGEHKPAVTNSFMPFGLGYRGGLSLGDRLANRAARRRRNNRRRPIDRTRRGEGLTRAVRGCKEGRQSIWPAPSTAPSPSSPRSRDFIPFDRASGVGVATTSTTIGADLLVSGVSQGKTAQVRKFRFVRPTDDATTIMAQPLGEVLSTAGSLPNVVGGD